MVELSEADQRAIMGDKWRAAPEPAAQDALSQVEQKLAAQQKTSVDRQFNAIALLIIGLVLATASYVRAGAAPYEHFFGIAVIAIAVAWLAYLRVAKARAG